MNTIETIAYVACLLVVAALGEVRVRLAEKALAKERAAHRMCHDVADYRLIQAIWESAEEALRSTADMWEDPENQPMIAALSRRYTPGGESVPAMFMGLIADRIAVDQIAAKTEAGFPETRKSDG